MPLGSRTLFHILQRNGEAAMLSVAKGQTSRACQGMALMPRNSALKSLSKRFKSSFSVRAGRQGDFFSIGPACSANRKYLINLASLTGIGGAEARDRSTRPFNGAWLDPRCPKACRCLGHLVHAISTESVTRAELFGECPLPASLALGVLL